MGCFLFLAAFSIVKIMLDADGGRAADARFSQFSRWKPT